MSLTNEEYVAQVKERLRMVHSIVTNDLDAEHQKNSGTIAAINKLHENSETSKLHQGKLKVLYSTALAEAESEEQVIRQALDKIYEIRGIVNERRIQVRHSNKETIRRGALMKALQSSAQTLPLWIGKLGEKPPALCGAIPADANYVAKVGDMVAALQRSTDGEDNWILAEVLNYNAQHSKYDLDDIDEEQKEKIVLSRRRVIPLPVMRANPETDPDALFGVSSIVMALYPQTTCFYKAVVSAPPTTHNDEYEVLFEDPSYQSGYSPALKVAQRYVIPHRDRKAKF